MRPLILFLVMALFVISPLALLLAAALFVNAPLGMLVAVAADVLLVWFLVWIWPVISDMLAPYPGPAAQPEKQADYSQVAPMHSRRKISDGRSPAP